MTHRWLLLTSLALTSCSSGGAGGVGTVGNEPAGGAGGAAGTGEQAGASQAGAAGAGGAQGGAGGSVAGASGAAGSAATDGGHWKRIDACPGGRCIALPTGQCAWTGSRWHWYVSERQEGLTFDPATGAVTAITALSPPSSRAWASWLWIAGRAWIWGGSPWEGEPGLRGDGATWDGSGAWTPLPTVGAPSPRLGAAVVDADGLAIVWGGATGGAPSPPVTPGAIWNSSTNTWSPMSTAGAPGDTPYVLTAWTGHEMLVLGWGKGPGAIYDPAQDAWRPMSTQGAPHDLSYAAGAWTGSRWLVVGKTDDQPPALAIRAYDLAQDQWTSLSSASALPPHPGYADLYAHWTGSRLLVANRQLGSAGQWVGIYTPDLDQWTLATTEDQPAFVALGCTAWDGQRLLTWGLRSALLDSGDYEDWTEVWAYEPPAAP